MFTYNTKDMNLIPYVVFVILFFLKMCVLNDVRIDPNEVTMT